MAAEQLRLVVADDTQLVLSVCSCLVDGCRRAKLVGVAQNGAEAVEVARSTRPDVLLLDLNMPVLNGLEAAARIRQELPETRIIFLTADDSDSIRQQCMDLGAYAVRPKLTSQAELCALMSELIGPCHLPPHGA